ncbi:ribosome assembly cofactor RimP [Nonlabens sp.]|uniref:ribosome assembly cofactor RimP n=1 Tax=Nonlabens sp. TaxID=1888209 RepID=UPI003F69B634
MLKEKVQDLLDDAFEERPDLFLMDMTIDGSNEIKVIIDGDEGVTVADCIFVSRAVEHNLDRDEIDFALEVASAGASAPLSFPRQFKRNVGRQLEVIDKEKRKETGELVDANDQGVVIQWKAREPKPVGKGKVTVQKEWSISYDDIKQAKVVITFN